MLYEFHSQNSISAEVFLGSSLSLGFHLRLQLLMWKLDDNRPFLKEDQNIKHSKIISSRYIFKFSYLLNLCFFWRYIFYLFFSLINNSVNYIPISYFSWLFSFHLSFLLLSSLQTLIWPPPKSSHWLSVLLQRKYFYPLDGKNLEWDLTSSLFFSFLLQSGATSTWKTTQN